MCKSHRATSDQAPCGDGKEGDSEVSLNVMALSLEDLQLLTEEPVRRDRMSSYHPNGNRFRIPADFVMLMNSYGIRIC